MSRRSTRTIFRPKSQSIIIKRHESQTSMFDPITEDLPTNFSYYEDRTELFSDDIFINTEQLHKRKHMKHSKKTMSRESLNNLDQIILKAQKRSLSKNKSYLDEDEDLLFENEPLMYKKYPENLKEDLNFPSYIDEDDFVDSPVEKKRNHSYNFKIIERSGKDKSFGNSKKSKKRIFRRLRPSHSSDDRSTNKSSKKKPKSKKNGKKKLKGKQKKYSKDKSNDSKKKKKLKKKSKGKRKKRRKQKLGYTRSKTPIKYVMIEEIPLYRVPEQSQSAIRLDIFLNSANGPIDIMRSTVDSHGRNYTSQPNYQNMLSPVVMSNTDDNLRLLPNTTTNETGSTFSNVPSNKFNHEQYRDVDVSQKVANSSILINIAKQGNNEIVDLANLVIPIEQLLANSTLTNPIDNNYMYPDDSNIFLNPDADLISPQNTTADAMSMFSSNPPSRIYSPETASSAKGQYGNYSTRSSTAAPSNQGHHANYSIRDSTANPSTQGHYANYSIRDSSVNPSIQGRYGNYSMRESSVNPSIQGHYANYSIRESSMNPSVQGRYGNYSMRESSMNPSDQGRYGNYSMRESSVNPSIQGHYANYSIRGSTANPSIQGHYANYSIRGSTANPSVQGHYANYSIRNSTANPSIRGNSTNYSIRDSSVNPSTQGHYANYSIRGSPECQSPNEQLDDVSQRSSSVLPSSRGNYANYSLPTLSTTPEVKDRQVDTSPYNTSISTIEVIIDSKSQNVPMITSQFLITTPKVNDKSKTPQFQMSLKSEQRHLTKQQRQIDHKSVQDSLQSHMQSEIANKQQQENLPGYKQGQIDNRQVEGNLPGSVKGFMENRYVQVNFQSQIQGKINHRHLQGKLVENMQVQEDTLSLPQNIAENVPLLFEGMKNMPDYPSHKSPTNQVQNIPSNSPDQQKQNLAGNMHVQEDTLSLPQNVPFNSLFTTKHEGSSYSPLTLEQSSTANPSVQGHYANYSIRDETTNSLMKFKQDISSISQDISRNLAPYNQSVSQVEEPIDIKSDSVDVVLKVNRNTGGEESNLLFGILGGYSTGIESNDVFGRIENFDNNVLINKSKSEVHFDSEDENPDGSFNSQDKHIHEHYDVSTSSIDIKFKVNQSSDVDNNEMFGNVGEMFGDFSKLNENTKTDSGVQEDYNLPDTPQHDGYDITTSSVEVMIKVNQNSDFETNDIMGNTEQYFDENVSKLNENKKNLKAIEPNGIPEIGNQGESPGISLIPDNNMVNKPPWYSAMMSYPRDYSSQIKTYGFRQSLNPCDIFNKSFKPPKHTMLADISGGMPGLICRKRCIHRNVPLNCTRSFEKIYQYHGNIIDNRGQLRDYMPTNFHQTPRFYPETSTRLDNCKNFNNFLRKQIELQDEFILYLNSKLEQLNILNTNLESDLGIIYDDQHPDNQSIT